MNVNEIVYNMPVKVIKGKHSGKIGYIDDIELPYVYVHFDDFTFGRINCAKINISNLREATHLDTV